MVDEVDDLMKIQFFARIALKLNFSFAQENAAPAEPQGR